MLANLKRNLYAGKAGCLDLTLDSYKESANLKLLFEVVVQLSEVVGAYSFQLPNYPEMCEEDLTAESFERIVSEYKREIIRFTVAVNSVRHLSRSRVSIIIDVDFKDSKIFIEKTTLDEFDAFEIVYRNLSQDNFIPARKATGTIENFLDKIRYFKPKGWHVNGPNEESFYDTSRNSSRSDFSHPSIGTAHPESKKKSYFEDLDTVLKRINPKQILLITHCERFTPEAIHLKIANEPKLVLYQFNKAGSILGYDSAQLKVQVQSFNQLYSLLPRIEDEPQMQKAVTL